MSKIHPSITTDRIVNICEHGDLLDNPGICIACGEDADGVEPDAREYVCETCEKPAVYGVLELLLML